MTRSKLQEAINVQQSRIAFEDDTYPKAQDQLMLDLLLAEQKRAAGCAYCNGNMLDGYALENMYGESQRIINIAMKNQRSGDQLPISFCPNCGRDLTEGESV
jgi:hypothetical protein